MATLTTFTAGTPILSADVNANFAALNTGVMSMGYSSNVAVGNILTGEDTLQSWTMPANTLATVGDGLLVRAHFTFAANANTKTIQFYIGSSAGGFFVNSTGAPNAKDLLVDWSMVLRNLTAFNNISLWGTTILCNTANGASAAFESIKSDPVGSISAGLLTSSAVVKFTGIGTATNDIVQNVMLISVFKAP